MAKLKLKYIKKYFLTSVQDAHSEDSIKSTLAELLILIHRNNNISTVSTNKKDVRLQNAIDYILQNYAEPLTLEECAYIACMSPSHFSRVFHKTTALSFKEFLNRIRIEEAVKLLESTKCSIAEIAQKVGFSTESYFGYIFRKNKTLSPAKYRIKFNKTGK